MNELLLSRSAWLMESHWSSWRPPGKRTARLPGRPTRAPVRATRLDPFSNFADATAMRLTYRRPLYGDDPRDSASQLLNERGPGTGVLDQDTLRAPFFWRGPPHFDTAVHQGEQKLDGILIAAYGVVREPPQHHFKGWYPACLRASRVLWWRLACRFGGTVTPVRTMAKDRTGPLGASLGRIRVRRSHSCMGRRP